MDEFKLQRKIEDRYDLEGAAFEVAEHIAEGDPDWTQVYFRAVREVVFEAYNAGRRSMTITGRIKAAIQNYKLNH